MAEIVITEFFDSHQQAVHEVGCWDDLHVNIQAWIWDTWAEMPVVRSVTL